MTNPRPKNGEAMVAPVGRDPFHQHVRWPADRFYWSIVESPFETEKAGKTWSGTPGRSTDDLRDLIEDALPVPTSEVHPIAAALGDGRLLVCAASREHLESLPPSTISLTPESLPAIHGLHDTSVSPLNLNLLVGEFEPRPLRRQRELRGLTMAIGAAACLLLVAVGLWRRAAEWSVRAAGADEQTRRLALQYAPQEPPTPNTTTQPQIALATLQEEVTSLRRTHAPHLARAAPLDAATTLASTLARWPDADAVHASLVAVQPNSITLTMISRERANAEAFLSKLTPPPGWLLEPPRLSANSIGTQLAIAMRPLPASAGGKP